MQERPSEREVDPDLVANLRLLIDEEAPLWEVPWESTRVTSTSTIRTGPWDPATCAEVLGRWLGAGLIGLYRCEQGSTREVPPDEAYVAISRWELWRPDGPQVFLYLTAEGADTADDRWLDAVHGDQE